MSDNEKILVAHLPNEDGVDFELWVDPDEWEGWDLPQRTARILAAHARYEVNQIEQAQPFYERLVENINDLRLKVLVWQAWLAIPPWERAVLEALGVKFVEEPVMVGVRALCRTYTKIENGWGPRPIIALDPERYQADDEDRTLHTIFHELAHAGYRTEDIRSVFEGNEPVYADLQDKMESFVDAMGYLWLDEHKKRMAKKASHNQTDDNV